MRGGRNKILPYVVLTAALAAGGCTPSPGATGQSAYTPPPSSPVGTSSSTVPGAFLATGDCAARTQTTGGEGFRQVLCTDQAAVARVTVRRTTGDAAHPDCPATTDFVLAISGGSAATGPVSDAHGYACLRDLRPPHPGDPGGGGGPNTIVGDCVYRAGNDQAKETACEGSGAPAPPYKVAAIVAHRSLCPPPTVLYVGVGHEKIGCAEPQRAGTTPVAR